MAYLIFIYKLVHIILEMDRNMLLNLKWKVWFYGLI